MSTHHPNSSPSNNNSNNGGNSMDPSLNGGERLPLLSSTSTRQGRPFTTPLPKTSPTNNNSNNNNNIGNSNNNSYTTTKGHHAHAPPHAYHHKTTTIHKPVALDANRNMFQKQSRPRKAVAEFRKKIRQSPLGSWSGRVGIHLHVDEIDIEKVMQVYTNGKDKEGWNAVDHFDVVRLWQTEPPYIGQELWSEWPVSEDEDGNTNTTTTTTAHQNDMTAAMPEIYLFSFGACVFWNFPNEDYEKQWIESILLNELEHACGDMYKEDEIESAVDSVSFQYGAVIDQPQPHQQTSSFAMKQDVCILSTRDSGEKLAVSFALAKSSLLSLYELRVQHVIERNSNLPQEMVENGRIRMTTKDMTREVGRLFLVKHGINLDQSLIDTPEEFWEDDRFEATYDTTLKYMKVGKRLDLVNSRLDMIGELHNKIMEENHTHHAEILEWIIIWLIVVEVLLDMLHLGFY